MLCMGNMEERRNEQHDKKMMKYSYIKVGIYFQDQETLERTYKKYKVRHDQQIIEKKLNLEDQF
jgi:hypothetical protein